MAKKQLILSAFVHQTPSHLNPGMFNFPEDRGREYKDIKHWVALAQKLEAAKFHCIFFADVLAGYDVYKKSLQPAIEAGAQFPSNDPTLSISAMAAATESIGFGVTSSTTYEQPYSLARKFSTLDHLTDGRIAWNVVTSYLESAARNFGLDTQIEHDERYRIADEYMEVVYKLWEGSWRDDAVLPPGDPQSRYADPARVREIRHEGKYFRVPGAHICEPSPQRTPFIFQAGTSRAGKAFAAKHAEAIFLGGSNPELVRKQVDDIRQQVTNQGRDPTSVKIIAATLVIVASTDEEAHAKYDIYRQYGNGEGALALFGGFSGYDLDKYADDQDVRFGDEPAVQTLVNNWAATVPGTDGLKWNKKTIADYLKVGGMGNRIIGSVKTVADELERWVDVADVDGFNFKFATIPGTFDDIAELLVPELRKRGLVWEDYPVKGGTFREILNGSGNSRLPGDHPGAEYAWRAGEDVPQYVKSSKPT
ncbi:Nitrilotriacetate monooxygenase component A pristinamycin IIA synthase subunit A [Fusarium albosuccineum]|uniref:Nitrilotriacetate monooxygenase component A pristinamycin IIA synthase subunit A n=1 Tax=Fusarium albosuccineum TaxID=1237068 RepID=A0A8H4PD36_9HYPO|nr:Nitrilotriacetate monooxygenase component A pristinamycin IIA synthase subunit A [Fusarium albosuccineum]